MKLSAFSEEYERQRENYFSEHEDPNNWIACMTPSKEFINSAVHHSVKAFLDNLYAHNKNNHDRIGFKEIQYGQAELELFRKCYPKAKIILLVRDPRNVWKSLSKGLRKKMYKNSVDNFIRKWNEHVTFYINFAEKDHETYLFKYEDIVDKKLPILKSIMDVADINIEELTSVLSFKIRGIRNSAKTKKAELKKINIKCKKVMKQLNYAVK
jgi:hypothetical protein